MWLEETGLKLDLISDIGMVMLTVANIIQNCGGAEAIERASGKDPADERKNRLSSWAVHKWRKGGIPERHWPLVMGILPDLTPQQLHDANEALRRTEGAAA